VKKGCNIKLWVFYGTGAYIKDVLHYLAKLGMEGDEMVPQPPTAQFVLFHLNRIPLQT
jgi:hypothetical protein